MEKKKELDRSLIETEIKVWNLETIFLREASGFLKGSLLDTTTPSSTTSGGGGAGPGRPPRQQSTPGMMNEGNNPINDADRIFSKSSSSYERVLLSFPFNFILSLGTGIT